jgi:DNA-binding response OmpR family regulator
MGEAGSVKRVLVVDDDANIRNIVRHVLEKAGYEVYTAENGEACVKAAVTAPPDAVLLDIMMPGKDGFDACAELKRIERTRDVPVIFLTAKKGDDSWTKALYRGAAAYLEKPFRNEALVALVGEVIHEHEHPEVKPAPRKPKKLPKQRKS